MKKSAYKIKRRELLSHFYRPSLFGLVLALLFSNAANAELEWYGDGFGTIGGGALNSNSINETNGFVHNEFDNSVQFDVDTRLGYQATLAFDEQLSATVQVLASGLDDFEPDVDWAYLSYQTEAGVKLNVGRLRRPSYTYSDYLNVGYAYPWIRPPVEVYSRDIAFYSQIDGASLFYQYPLDEWTGSVQLYYGGTSDEAEVAFGEEVKFKTRNDFGVFFSLENAHFNIRLGYQKLPEVDVGNTSGAQLLNQSLRGAGFASVAEALATDDLRSEFYNFALGMNIDNWQLNAEYIQVELSRSIGPEEYAWYVMGGRQLGPMLLHYTYSERKRENKENFSGPIRAVAATLPPAGAGPLIALADGVDTAATRAESEQNSHTFGLRYDFNKPYTLKIEYQIISDEQNNLSNNLVSVAVDFIF